MASDTDILSPTEASTGGSIKGLIIGVAISTLVAVGAGAGIGMQFSSMITPAGKSDADKPGKPGKPKIGKEKKTKEEKPEPIAKTYIDKRTVKSLPPILTNLAAPKNAWVRIEASIIVEGEKVDTEVLALQIAEDTLAYLRTLSLSDIEGGSGLAHLRSDLGERAAVRSEGKVLEFVIGSMVVE